MKGIPTTKAQYWKIVLGDITSVCFLIEIDPTFRMTEKANRMMYFRKPHAKKFTKKVKPYIAGDTTYLQEQISLHPVRSNKTRRVPGSDYIVYRNDYSNLGEEMHEWLSPSKTPQGMHRVMLLCLDAKPVHLLSLRLNEVVEMGYPDPRQFIREWNQNNPAYPRSSDPWVYLVKFRVMDTIGITPSKLRTMRERIDNNRI